MWRESNREPNSWENNGFDNGRNESRECNDEKLLGSTEEIEIEENNIKTEIDVKKRRPARPTIVISGKRGTPKK